MMRIARSTPAGELGKGDYIAVDTALSLHEGALVSEVRLHRILAVKDTDAGITFTVISESHGDPMPLTDMPEDRLFFRGEYR